MTKMDYTWRNIITVIGITFFVPFFVFGSATGMVLSALAISLLLIAHVKDVTSYESAEAERIEREERLAHNKEEANKLILIIEEQQKRIAEQQFEHAKVLKDTYTILYGEDFAKEYEQLTK